MKISNPFKNNTSPFVLIPIFIWIGFVCSISFMEAWLKFRAAGVSLSIGLNIGSLVFAALNKVEWGLAILTIIFIFLSKEKIGKAKSLLFYTPFAILVFQTFVLLPSLYERVNIISQGLAPPPSHIHFYYIILETVKVLSLLILGTGIVYNLSRNLSFAEGRIPQH